MSELADRVGRSVEWCANSIIRRRKQEGCGEPKPIRPGERTS